MSPLDSDHATPERLPDRSVRHFLSSFWHHLIGVDGRFRRTLRGVLLDPGELPRRHLDELHLGEAQQERQTYLHPIRVYLVVNLLFFLIVPFLNNETGSVWDMHIDSVTDMPPDTTSLLEFEIDRARSEHGKGTDGVDPEALYRAVFDERVRSMQGAFVALMIPIQAIVLHLLFWPARLRRRRPESERPNYLADHLLFATSLMAWYLLVLLAIGLPLRLITSWAPGGWQFRLAMFVLAFTFLVLPLGVWRGLRTFYRLRWWIATLLMPVVVSSFLVATLLYGKALFFYALASMRL